MRNHIGYTKPLGAAWAASEVGAPFLFLPFPVAAGTNLPATGIAPISNIAAMPATFAVVDADASADNNEGYFSPDVTTDADYIWPGHADYDAVAHGLHTLGNFLTPGTVNGEGGGILLIACHIYTPNPDPGAGAILTFGVRNATAGADGWSIGMNSTNGINLAIQNNGALVQGDITAASVVYDAADHKFALLLDAQNAEILTYYDGVSVTPGGKAALLAAMDAQDTARMPVSWHFGGLQSATVAGTRTNTTSPGARLKSLLIMNLSNYSGDAQADFPALADALYRAPAYALPRYLERF